MRKKKKKIVYLDQFASSNLAAANEEGLWLKIRVVIENLVNKRIICCPLSLEHYVETSGRDYQRANEQTSFFQKISGGLIFNVLEIIISNEITHLIRRGDNRIMHSSYLTKLGDALIFKDVHKYNQLHSYKTDYNDFIEAEHCFVNEIRKENKQNSRTASKINLSIIQQTCMKLSCQRILERLEEVCKNGNITIQGEIINDIEYPSQIDCVIYNLMKAKRFTLKEMQALKSELEKHMFDRIPSLCVKYSLQSLWAVDNTKQISNDVIDLERAASALAISDYYFTDAKRKNELLALGLDKKYNTSIYSAKEHDLKAFLEDLGCIC